MGKNERAFKRTPVQNHVYANKIRRTNVRVVRQSSNPDRFSSPSVHSSPTSYIHCLSHGKSFQFFGSFHSVYLFSLFFQPVFRPLFESCGLVFSHVFTNFYAYSPPLLVFQPFIYPIFPFPSFTSPPLRVFHNAGHIFSAIFSAIWSVSLKCLSQSRPAA